jgi:hypothetical protein
MSTNPRLIETRLEQVEKMLGIKGVGSVPAMEVLPVNTVVIMAENSAPLFGTWNLLGSGNMLGGSVGTVYAFQRTA